MPDRKGVYTVIEVPGEARDRWRWVKIGVGFVNRDGSLNLILDALPVNGRVHVRDFPANNHREGVEK